MNKWNKLLLAFDELYGFEDKLKSTFRKLGQTYDERTNEYVYRVEYRVRRGIDSVKVTKNGNPRLINTLIDPRNFKRS